MARNLVLLSVALIAALPALSQTSTAKSREELNLGVQAYKNNSYAQAVAHFKQALSLDPSNQDAQLFLATAYMVQWVPGVDSPDNLKIYESAKQQFEAVLQKDSTNSQALASLASMAFNSAQGAANPEQKTAALEEARKWNQRRIEVDPQNAEAFYYLGVISWVEAFIPIQTARVKAEMRVDDPGPFADATVRQQLAGRFWKTIAEGINDLKACLAIDNENEDAMSYMNLLLRIRAPLEDSTDAAKADIAEGEEWSNKSLEMKKIKAGRPPRS